MLNRVDVAIVAIRAVALWLFVGSAAAASIVLMRLAVVGTSAPQRPVEWPLIVAFVRFVAAAMLWASAKSFAAFLFRDEPHDVNSSDLYRTASAFTGLFVLGESVPQLIRWIAAWLFSFRTGQSVFGALGLNPQDRSALFDVQTKAAFVGTVVQVVLGAVLLGAPAQVEGFLTRLRREDPGLARDTDE